MASDEPVPDLAEVVMAGFHEIGGDWSRAGLEPIVALLKEAIDQKVFTPDPLIPLQIEPSRECFERVKSQWIQSQVGSTAVA